MSVRAAQREVNSREFTEWRAFDRISPLTDRRIDYNAAMVAATIVNVMTDERTTVKVSDLVLDFGGKTRSTPEEIERKALAIAKRINAAQAEGEKENGGDSR